MNTEQLYEAPPEVVDAALESVGVAIGEPLDEDSEGVLRVAFNRVRSKSPLDANKLLAHPDAAIQHVGAILKSPPAALSSLVADEHLRAALRLSIPALLKATEQRAKHPDLLSWISIRSWVESYRAAIARPREDSRVVAKSLESILASGLLRKEPALPDAAQLLALARTFPNFHAVTEFFAQQATFLRRRNGEFQFQPVLLAGPPGVGKTEFLRRLSISIGLNFTLLDMGSTSAGFVLNGLAAGWGNATPGIVFEKAFHARQSAHFFMLDEIDKAIASGDKSPPMNPLYQLLEPSTARHFRDEFYAVEFNAARNVWVATANDLSAIPAPLLSRFRVFEIGIPDEVQIRAIAQSVYAEASYGLADVPKQLPSEWWSAIQSSSIRELKQNITEAIGRALLRSELENRELVFEKTDLISSTTSPKKIGFI